MNKKKQLTASCFFYVIGEGKMNYVRLILLVLMALPNNAAAQVVKAVPDNPAQVELSYAPIVRSAAPAVVNIYTSQRIKTVESPFMADPFFQQFFGRNMPGFNLPSRTRERTVNSLGSGVIISAQGMIVTSHHVIKDAQEIKVVLSDKREFVATLEFKDPKADVAFLSIQAPTKVPHLTFRDSDTLEVGDLVLAIGNPFGVGQTVTSGIVSALARKAAGVSDYQFFIQTDAAINPGNSGGALVDMQGRLVGINTAIYSRTGGSQGIGFAIPANMVRSLLAQRGKGGKIIRPWAGITGQTVTGDMAESLGMKVPGGAIVTRIHPSSTTRQAGLQEGDVIIALNDISITSIEDLYYRFALLQVGQKAAMSVMRKGVLREITVRVISAPETAPRDVRMLKGNHPFSGVTVANASPALAAELGLPDTLQGVVVTAAPQGGGLIGGQLQPGDVILKVNDQNITSSQQLQILLEASSRNWQIVYAREGNVMTLSVRM